MVNAGPGKYLVMDDFNAQPPTDGPFRLSRRGLGALGALGALAVSAAAAEAQTPRSRGPSAVTLLATELGVDPASTQDQTAALQSAIDQAAQRGVALHIPAGRYIVGRLVLKANSIVSGVAGRTVLTAGLQGICLAANEVRGVQVRDLTVEGMMRAPFGGARGLVTCDGVRDLVLDGLHVFASATNGIALTGTGGRVDHVRIDGCKGAALWSTDARGLEIASCLISDCADNGILVWRSAPGEDGTIVRDNRIQRIANISGGSGQWGNGINVYRAGGVLVTGNHISDCAYTAIRGNAASNIQMVGNTALRSGEVALYAEFGFEGALIANNLVDGAGTGIAVTNFNEGGRLAVVQGNVVRNLKRREHEPVDKRGEGIGIEADAVVTGNVIENAPTAGMLIGWGRYMRDVVATGNLIRRTKIGIAVTGDTSAGQCLIAQNMISGATDGAIRAMNHAQPITGDLALQGARPPGRISVQGNIVG
ncbi:MAG: hypothetical protein RL291_1200 [Pseudomonadota bacterium]|jgi:uncharacterized secreted repeat protein (TIGR03808 family)